MSILKNEKYNGTLKQRKTITPDYLSHKAKINYGEEKFIVIENNHAPIVSKEIFDRVQTEIQRRRTAKVERSRYSNRYVFSGKIECASCNSKFERRFTSQKADKRQVVWRCAEAVKYGKEKINAQGQKVGCNCKAVHETFLKGNFLAVLNSVIENKNLVVRELRTAVSQVIAGRPDNADEMRAITANIDRITARKLKLIDTFVDGLITRAEFEQANSRYNTQLEGLRKQLSSLELGNKTVETLHQKLDNIDIAIENLARLKEFGDSVCSEVLHKIIVEKKKKISFYLKTNEKASMFVKMPLL
jgi:nitrous oxide reductase